MQNSSDNLLGAGTKWVGDFLLLFQPLQQLPRARGNSSWSLAHATAETRLYLSSAQAGWKGSPCSHWQAGGYEYWLFGEIWGDRGSLPPHAWPGHFVLLGFHSICQTWNIWTDRCGTFHVYYAATPHQTAVGSFSPAVASATENRLDYLALTGFFSFGFFPGDATYIQDLKIIRPSSHLEFDLNGKLLRESREWQWEHQPDFFKSFDEAVDRFAELFHQIIREQCQGKRVAFPISGGLDSRSTISAVSHRDIPGERWAYSYGYTPDSIETRIAQQIALARNLKFSKYTIKPYIFEKAPIIIDSLEGFQDILQSRQAFVLEEIASHADYLMAAHWGDVWFDDMGLAGKAGPISKDEFVDFALKKFFKGGDWLVKEISHKVIPQFNPKEHLHDLLAREIEPLQQILDPDFRLKALKTELWSFRWTTASLRMFQAGAFPLLPFYDPRMVDFFSRIPTRFVVGRKMQVEYLKRYAPDLARVNWQVYNANLYWYPYFNSLLLPQRLYQKTRLAFSQKEMIQRNWEVQFLNPSGRQNLMTMLLNSGSKLAGIVSTSALADLIEHFYSDPTEKQSAYVLSMLVTFSSWLEANGG